MAETESVYVNQAEGLNRMMNNTKLYVKLLNKFKTDVNIDELIALVKAQDYEKAQVVVHTIKGVAANLSLTELYKQSLDLENQIKGTSIRDGYPEAVKDCFDKTLISIDKVIAQYG
jgi:HPt (histidine-containing phosphotransfer) domain-containing protein